MAVVAEPPALRARTWLARRVTVREIAWLLLAIVAAMVAWRVLRWGMDKADPRRAILRVIRAEADPRRDVVVFTDESPELVAEVAPVPAVFGAPSLSDLTAFRRLYVVAPTDAGLVPFESRLGVATSNPGANAMRWDLDSLAAVRFDLLTALPTGQVVAHRDGGPHAGPCERAGAMLRCHSPDDWNHLRVEEHAVAGVMTRCLSAHPQVASQLVIDVPALPRARELVGMVAIDDRAWFPTGAAVTNHLTFTPEGGGAVIQRDLVAPNRRGPTPYRVDLGARAGRLTFRITTPDAGARQFCFTAYATGQ